MHYQPGMFCLVAGKNFGQCAGDSGGPVMALTEMIPGSTVGGCEYLQYWNYTMETKVVPYCDWIFEGQAATGCRDRIVEADGLPPASGIVGGVEISVEDYPFIVSIGHLDSVTKKFEHQCGASIIDQRWLLTAGHCLRSLGVNGAVAGSTHTGAHPDKNAQTFTFEEKHTHPDYIDEDGFPQDDVALIKLAKPIHSSSKLCFDGGNKARGTCDGDSGSPLVYCNRRINKFVQASLVSEGTGLCGSKDDDTIGPVVSRHCDWIEKTIDKKICITE
ncbi:unnamed protein product, partial [Mesorhabditis spiculigera]